jgi:phage baseplate assembly protein gpV
MVLPGFNRSDQQTAAAGMAEMTDNGRRLHNLVRYGIVYEANYEEGEIRVSTQDGELITDWIPWATMRAGGDLSWWAPEVGEVVLLLAPSGELSNAVALPAAFSNDRRPANRETVKREVFADGAVHEYDRERHRHLIDLTGVEDEDSEIWLRGQKRIFLNAVGPEARILLRAEGEDGEIRLEAASIVMAPPPGLSEVKILGVEASPLIIQAKEISLNPNNITEAAAGSGGWLPNFDGLDIPDVAGIAGPPAVEPPPPPLELDL